MIYIHDIAHCNNEHFKDESEMVNQDLEEAAEQYAYEEWPSIGIPNTVIELAFKAGAEWQKQQMMKNAVDATIHEGLSNKYIKEKDKDAFDKALANFEDGDKVKIIIVKTEQQ